ncbi:Protein Jade-1 [Boothiomyces sp. JEL0866]|nr:Protein Jade-1 [Boothiomyces sp. JEL0866]
MKRNRIDDSDSSGPKSKSLKIQDLVDSTEESEGSGSEEDEPCVICGDEETTSKNLLIFCDGKECYGVNEVPPGDEKWHCHRCEDGIPVNETEAICCPVKGGAFKRTNFPKKYIHVPCAWWNPAVEANKDGYSVEKWLLDKQICYVCNSSKGLTIRCKSPGCKKYLLLMLRWFHVLCAVENETLKLSKPKDVKHTVMCDEHNDDSRSSNLSQKKKKVDDSYSATEEESSQESEKEAVEKPKPKKNTTIPKHIQDRMNGNKTNGTPTKPTPVDIKNSRLLRRFVETYAGNILPTPKKESKSSPLDSLLDSAFDESLSKTVELKDQEIQSLKAQLSARPTIEVINRLQEENNLLKSKNGVTADLNLIAQYRTNQENIIAIFSHLQIPNLGQPNETNISQFLSSLRSVLERTNTSNDTKN